MEIYGPDSGLVEDFSRRFKARLKDRALSYTGPAASRASRWFSLRDYADRYNGAEERKARCLVHRYAVLSITQAFVDELLQFTAPTGLRVMVRTRSKRLPAAPIVTGAVSNWQDE